MEFIKQMHSKSIRGLTSACGDFIRSTHLHNRRSSCTYSVSLRTFVIFSSFHSAPSISFSFSPGRSFVLVTYSHLVVSVVLQPATIYFPLGSSLPSFSHYRVSNVQHTADIVAPVLVPDVSAGAIMSRAPSPAVLPPSPPLSPPSADAFPRFSMAAGDFTALYSTPDSAGQWDAIVTCFFLDTAPVIIE